MLSHYHSEAVKTKSRLCRYIVIFPLITVLYLALRCFRLSAWLISCASHCIASHCNAFQFFPSLLCSVGLAESFLLLVVSDTFSCLKRLRATLMSRQRFVTTSNPKYPISLISSTRHRPDPSPRTSLYLSPSLFDCCSLWMNRMPIPIGPKYQHT